MVIFLFTMSKSKSPRFVLPRPTFPDLATYIQRTGDTQEHIAAVIGVTQAHLSRIVAGRVVPRPAVALALATYAKIPIESFTLMYLQQQGNEVA
jgi:transcriptional regulator with XRE-family HTH domain